MPDELDLVGEQIDRELQTIIANRRKAETANLDGRCWFCENWLPEPSVLDDWDPVRWCDRECRDNYEKLSKRG